MIGLGYAYIIYQTAAADQFTRINVNYKHKCNNTL